MEIVNKIEFPSDVTLAEVVDALDDRGVALDLVHLENSFLRGVVVKWYGSV